MRKKIEKGVWALAGKRKRFRAALLALLLLTLGPAACGCAQATDEIYVISREDGSGTRSAFAELLDVLDENGYDCITERAEITNSTSVVMLSVEGSPNAIGYLSLGSLTDGVTALEIDGAAATLENVISGAYPVARPFLLATRGEAEGAAADFIAFILSDRGQAVIESAGYAGASEGEPYVPSGVKGRITVAGSTSVAPVMDMLADAYKELNPGTEVEIQQTGSSAGLQSVEEGVCQIGMSSRQLSEAELAAGLLTVTIAMDGIAVVVNNACPVRAMTSKQVRDIFAGRITRWSELEGSAS
jgi:phosphate transport system substrate-binding protein